MVNTPNKGYNAQTTGTNPNTWGDVLNDEALAYIDLNLGGIVSKGLTSSNVTLSASESRNLICRLTGNISANIVVTTVALGMTLVENATTGAFTVSFGLAGTEVEIPQGTSAVVATSAGNSRIVADNKPEFPSGTTMLFRQAAAPTGWTGDATAWNHAIRMVAAGSGGGTGGSVAFTTAFASQAVSGTVLNTTLNTAQIPAHSHSLRTDVTYASDGSGPAGNSPGFVMIDSAGNWNPGHFSSISECIADAGSGGAHNHGFTGNAINLAVQYANCIFATKN